MVMRLLKPYYHRSYDMIFVFSQIEKNSTLVDCQWGHWIHGECSKTCGGGVQTNQREKITEALFGGEECVGEATEEKECNVLECCEYHFAWESLNVIIITKIDNDYKW